MHVCLAFSFGIQYGMFASARGSEAWACQEYIYVLQKSYRCQNVKKIVTGSFGIHKIFMYLI
jgi:hypothetical protein